MQSFILKVKRLVDDLDDNVNDALDALVNEDPKAVMKALKQIFPDFRYDLLRITKGCVQFLFSGDPDRNLAQHSDAVKKWVAERLHHDPKEFAVHREKVEVTDILIGELIKFYNSVMVTKSKTQRKVVPKKEIEAIVPNIKAFFEHSGLQPAGPGKKFEDPFFYIDTISVVAKKVTGEEGVKCVGELIQIVIHLLTTVDSLKRELKEAFDKKPEIITDIKAISTGVSSLESKEEDAKTIASAHERASIVNQYFENNFTQRRDFLVAIRLLLEYYLIDSKRANDGSLSNMILAATTQGPERDSFFEIKKAGDDAVHNWFSMEENDRNDSVSGVCRHIKICLDFQQYLVGYVSSPE